MLIFFEKKIPFILCYTNMILTSLVNDGFLLTKLLFFFQALHNYILGQFFICVVEILKLNYFTTEIPSGKKTPKYFFEITDELPCRTSVNVLVYRLIVLNGFIWITLSGFAVIAMSKTKIGTVHVADQKLFYILENSKWS